MNMMNLVIRLKKVIIRAKDRPNDLFFMHVNMNIRKRKRLQK